MATTNEAPNGEITPEEAARVRAAVGKREQAPSSRQQSMLFDSWRDAADQLGSPFEVERIPVSKLRAMRRDPMLGFGLSFIKTPHVRARWHMNAKSPNGPNAQIAAHADHDMRRIYASFMLQMLNILDFGFQAIGKRFEFGSPAGTFVETNPDTGEETESPIWSEGNVDPIRFKPFVALPPETVEPLWTPQGEFNGINYKPSGNASPAGGMNATPRSGGANDSNDGWDIDLYHSLWATHEKEQNFGSIFGYPRLGYAYRYWWSYWFRWSIADRAFEKKADPSVLVRHPDGDIDLGNGETMPAGEYALLMGERMRSGGVIALPSEVYEDQTGKGNVPLWDIAFTKDATNFDPFDKSFDYLDIQKLRALAIPEQAFLEGKGGTSSRNVAAELGDSFTESQAVLSAQLVDQINRYVLPQWLAVNYPEFMAEGGTVTLVMQGFADEDIAFTTQVINLIGQQESGMREVLKLVDLKKLLESRGTPIASFDEQQRRQQEMVESAQAAAPPLTAPVPGEAVGVVPNGAGFATYINPREVIHLSESGTDFIESLPPSQHYEDKAIKGFSRSMWNAYNNLYRDEYESIISEIEEGEAPIEFSDDVELAVMDYVDRARELVRDARGSRLWPQTLQLSQNLLGKIMRRAARVELSRSRLKGRVDQEQFDDWLEAHLAQITSKINETTRGEVRDFMARKMQEGVTDRVELAQLAREHFAEFPKWKTDRLVRTEVRDAYNQATLIAAEANGIELVQATDADSGDTDKDCMDRAGKVFTVAEAKEEDEHPNGTLGWKIVPIQLSIETAELDGRITNFIPEEGKVQFAESVLDPLRREYLQTVVDFAISQREEVDAI